MKLRNKKTGEIWDIGKVLVNDYPCWETLTQICEDWEDVKEPLIKDEKIRKAVRIWAEVNGATGATELRYYDDENCLIDLFRNEIHFNQLLGLEDDKTYTVTELCGEAEE